MLCPVNTSQHLSPITLSVVYPPHGAGLKPDLYQYLSQDMQDLQIMLFNSDIFEPVGLLPALPLKLSGAVQQFGPYVFGLCDFFRRAGEFRQTGSSSIFGQIIGFGNIF